MAENPTSVFPDIQVQWDMTPKYINSTRVTKALNGREVRKAYYPSGGYIEWSFSTQDMDQVLRKTVIDFMKTKRGQFESFYFWEPEYNNFSAYSVGTITASRYITVPLRYIQATLDEDPAVLSATVAGVPKAFTIIPNNGTYKEDTLDFGINQTGAVLITCAARRRIIVRFKDDEMVENFIQNALNAKSILKCIVTEVR